MFGVEALRNEERSLDVRVVPEDTHDHSGILLTAAEGHEHEGY